jgi:hypothetical protein
MSGCLKIADSVVSTESLEFGYTEFGLDNIIPPENENFRLNSGPLVGLS